MTMRTTVLSVILSMTLGGCGWLFPGGTAASVTIVDGALSGQAGPAVTEVDAMLPVATEVAYRTHVLYATSEVGFQVEVEVEIDALDSLSIGTEIVHRTAHPDARIALHAEATADDGAVYGFTAETLHVFIEAHPTDPMLRRARFEATYTHEGSPQTMRGFFDYELPVSYSSSDSDSDWEIDEWD